MGAVAPYPLSEALRDRILRGILEPLAQAMCEEGTPYRGILFAGLMLTDGGPKVLEFNCRLGDPEAQVVLPLLRIGLPDAFEALRRGTLGPRDLVSPKGAAVGVVLASGGYPDRYQVGYDIRGLDDAAADALVFHNGTAVRNGRLVTAGGRVLTVVGQADSLAAAREAAYRAAGRTHFEGMHFRRDIGVRVPGAMAPVPEPAPAGAAREE
ncbi:MAG: phosphoribosylamine--glycine ligase, partial [Armatimonadetes bacterium]|nr:phosphoribosylamine--glycine ligase [Armatimonadota bacterium]